MSTVRWRRHRERTLAAALAAQEAEAEAAALAAADAQAEAAAAAEEERYLQRRPSRVNLEHAEARLRGVQVLRRELEELAKIKPRSTVPSPPIAKTSPAESDSSSERRPGGSGEDGHKPPDHADEASSKQERPAGNGDEADTSPRTSTKSVAKRDEEGSPKTSTKSVGKRDEEGSPKTSTKSVGKRGEEEAPKKSDKSVGRGDDEDVRKKSSKSVGKREEEGSPKTSSIDRRDGEESPKRSEKSVGIRDENDSPKRSEKSVWIRDEEDSSKRSDRIDGIRSGDSRRGSVGGDSGDGRSGTRDVATNTELSSQMYASEVSFVRRLREEDRERLPDSFGQHEDGPSKTEEWSTSEDDDSEEELPDVCVRQPGAADAKTGANERPCIISFCFQECCRFILRLLCLSPTPRPH